MIRLAVVFFLGLCGVAQAQGPILPGPGLPVAAGSSYSGPGDVVSGAYTWYSCSRGYNAADTANACNVCLPSDTVCADLTLTNGFAVLPGSLSTCNITTVICTVKIVYDKSGNGRNWTQNTEASRPRFRPAMASNGCPTTTLPCMKIVGTVPHTMTASGGLFAQSQPVTWSFVYIYDGRDGELFCHYPAFINIVSGGVKVRAGNNPSASTAANGSWHAVQGVLNTTSSATYIDGSATTGISAGSGNPANNVTLGLACDFQNPSAYVTEMGIWPIAFNSTQAGDMNTNQHSSANGYNF